METGGVGDGGEGEGDKAGNGGSGSGSGSGRRRMGGDKRGTQALPCSVYCTGWRLRRVSQGVSSNSRKFEGWEIISGAGPTFVVADQSSGPTYTAYAGEQYAI